MSKVETKSGAYTITETGPAEYRVANERGETLPRPMPSFNMARCYALTNGAGRAWRPWG